jgi:hypothetical protein
MWDHESLYADRSSDDEQLLIDRFCEKLKIYEHGGLLDVKINILLDGQNS